MRLLAPRSRWIHFLTLTALTGIAYWLFLTPATFDLTRLHATPTIDKPILFEDPQSAPHPGMRTSLAPPVLPLDWRPSFDIQVTPIDLTPITLHPVTRQHYQRYAQPIAPNAPAVLEFVQKAITVCNPGDRMCELLKIYKGIQDLPYVPDPAGSELIRDPTNTLTQPGGDCEDHAIVLASALTARGFPSYILMIPRHAYTLACQVDVDQFRESVSAELLERYGQPSMDDQVTIKPRSMRIYRLNNRSPAFLRYAATATAPLQIEIFPSIEAAQRAMTGEPYEGQLCGPTDQLTPQGSCTIPTEAILGITNWGTTPSALALRTAYSQPLPQNALPQRTLHLYKIDDMVCAPLDGTYKGQMVIPGMESPDITLVTQTEVLDTWGNVLRLNKRTEQQALLHN